MKEKGYYFKINNNKNIWEKLAFWASFFINRRIQLSYYKNAIIVISIWDFLIVFGRSNRREENLKIKLTIGISWEVRNIKQDLLINEQIRFREVQVIDETGNKLGKLKIDEALNIALDKNMDLVLVSANSENPVCKIMNYGKYKFEQAKKEKESKKKQKVAEIKEIRITPSIEEHDFNFKSKNARKFLEDGNKVKITIRFRGRELNYVKLGEDVLNKFIETLSDISTSDKRAKLEGKNMFIILSPINK